MKKHLLLFLAIAFAYIGIAQTVSIDGIKGTRFRGVNTITSPEDESVAGYYTY